MPTVFHNPELREFDPAGEFRALTVEEFQALNSPVTCHAAGQLLRPSCYNNSLCRWREAVPGMPLNPAFTYRTRAGLNALEQLKVPTFADLMAGVRVFGETLHRLGDLAAQVADNAEAWHASLPEELRNPKQK